MVCTFYDLIVSAFDDPLIQTMRVIGAHSLCATFEIKWLVAVSRRY